MEAEVRFSKGGKYIEYKTLMRKLQVQDVHRTYLNPTSMNDVQHGENLPAFFISRLSSSSCFILFPTRLLYSSSKFSSRPKVRACHSLNIRVIIP